MTIFELMFIFRFVGTILAILLIWVLFIKRHEILSFFYPQNYALVTMLEADNNATTWLQRKNSDLTFTFNEGTYNLFDLSPLDNPALKDSSKPPVLFKKVTAIYRSGRLAHYFFNEGNSEPIDFRNITSTTNPQLTGQLKKTEIMKLFINESNDFMSILNKAMPFILIIGIIIIIAILIRQPPQQTAAITPAVP